MSELDKNYIESLQRLNQLGSEYAATALKRLFDSKVELSGSQTYALPLNEAVEHFGQRDQLTAATHFQIQGSTEANALILLEVKQAQEIIAHMTQSMNQQADIHSEIGQSCLKELGNILWGSYISALNDYAKLDLKLSTPSHTIDMLGSILDGIIAELGDNTDFVLMMGNNLALEQGTFQIQMPIFLDGPSMQSITQNI